MLHVRSLPSATFLFLVFLLVRRVYPTADFEGRPISPWCKSQATSGVFARARETTLCRNVERRRRRRRRRKTLAFSKNEKTKRRNEGKTRHIFHSCLHIYILVNSNNNAMGGGGEIALNDKKNVKNDNLTLLSSSFRGQIFATADDVRKTKQNGNILTRF